MQLNIGREKGVSCHDEDVESRLRYALKLLDCSL
jgi:hypothetical protein